MKNLFLSVIAIAALSCSKDDNDSNPSNTSCNDVVCGSPGNNTNGVYYIYRGTIDPDTCGLTVLQVNQATYNFYKAKWEANPEGYACWEGLK
jgi:hypothetical protein